MTGNGKHTIYKNGDLGDGLWHCFTHIIPIETVFFSEQVWDNHLAVGSLEGK